MVADGRDEVVIPKLEYETPSDAVCPLESATDSVALYAPGPPAVPLTFPVESTPRPPPDIVHV